MLQDSRNAEIGDRLCMCSSTLACCRKKMMAKIGVTYPGFGDLWEKEWGRGTPMILQILPCLCPTPAFAAPNAPGDPMALPTGPAPVGTPGMCLRPKRAAPPASCGSKTPFAPNAAPPRPTCIGTRATTVPSTTCWPTRRCRLGCVRGMCGERFAWAAMKNSQRRCWESEMQKFCWRN